MTSEKLDELYALATSTNPACEWTESMGFVNPLLIVDLIDRVRELEAALKIAQKFCNSHSAEDCPDEVAIPINLAVDKDYYK